MRKNIQQIANNTENLDLKSLQNTKGGLLLYCEEKRVKTIFGTEKTVQQWRVANDNSIFLTVRM